VISQPKVARILIFAASIVLLVITYLGYRHISKLISTSNLVDHSNEIRLQLEKAYGHLRETDSYLNSYIITGDLYFNEQFTASNEKVKANIATLYVLMKKNSEQCYKLYLLEALINERHDVMIKSLEDAKKDNVKINTANVQEYSKLIYENIRTLQREEQALLARHAYTKDKQASITPLHIFILAIFSLVIMLFAYYEINQELKLRTWMQRELEAKNMALANTNKELEHFVFGSSHDLQEPLRKIETFCSLMERKKLLENQQEGIRLLNNIQVSAKRMRAMVNNLSCYAQFFHSSDKINMVSLNEVVAEVLHDYQPFLEEKKAIVEVDLLPVIKGLKPQLYRLFQHLISNAIKYSDNKKTPRIIIKSSRIDRSEIEEKLPPNLSGEFFKVSVEDNGIGFEEQYTDKIFMMFQRLHGKDHYEGTGIGLAICRKIVENHGGYISAKSVKNAGAVFNVYLPATNLKEETPMLQNKTVSKF
jgi:signal transduction histidine kinase